MTEGREMGLSLSDHLLDDEFQFSAFDLSNSAGGNVVSPTTPSRPRAAVGAAEHMIDSMTDIKGFTVADLLSAHSLCIAQFAQSPPEGTAAGVPNAPVAEHYGLNISKSHIYPMCVSETVDVTKNVPESEYREALESFCFGEPL